MDTRTPCKLEGARQARAPAAGALCALALISLLGSSGAAAQTAPPSLAQQALLLYTRITGVPPTGQNLTTVQNATEASLPAVATLALQQPQFYNVTLRNIFAAESNRDNSVFVPLNDYIVTAIGMVHDDVPYNTALSADILYTLKGVSPAASASNNNHYQAADTA